MQPLAKVTETPTVVPVVAPAVVGSPSQTDGKRQSELHISVPEDGSIDEAEVKQQMDAFEREQEIAREREKVLEREYRDATAERHRLREEEADRERIHAKEREAEEARQFAAIALGSTIKPPIPPFDGPYNLSPLKDGYLSGEISGFSSELNSVKLKHHPSFYTVGEESTKARAIKALLAEAASASNSEKVRHGVDTPLGKVLNADKLGIESVDSVNSSASTSLSVSESQSHRFTTLDSHHQEPSVVPTAVASDAKKPFSYASALGTAAPGQVLPKPQPIISPFANSNASAKLDIKHLKGMDVIDVVKQKYSSYTEALAMKGPLRAPGTPRKQGGGGFSGSNGSSKGPMYNNVSVNSPFAYGNRDCCQRDSPPTVGGNCPSTTGTCVTTVSSIVRKLEQNVVALSIGKGLPFATGLAIHPLLVLTARHAIEGTNVSELIVRTNFQKMPSTTGGGGSTADIADKSGNNTQIDYWSHLDVLGIVEESLDYDYTILLLRLPVQNFRCFKLHVKPPIIANNTDNASMLDTLAAESAVFIHHPYGWTKKVSVQVPMDSSCFLPSVPTPVDRHGYERERVRDSEGEHEHDRDREHGHDREHDRSSVLSSTAAFHIDDLSSKHHNVPSHHQREDSMSGGTGRGGVSGLGTPYHYGTAGGVYINANEEIFAMQSLPTNKQLCALNSNSLHSQLTSNITGYTTANYLHSIYQVSSVLSYLYDHDGNYLHRDLPDLTDLVDNNTIPHSSGLPRSNASKVYHNYIEAMKAKPKSFLSANQRYPHSLIQLTLHHIIPKSNMEFLWMIAKMCPEVEEKLQVLAWSKHVHEISVEGVLALRGLIDHNTYLKNIWESAVYGIEDSLNEVFVILPSAVQRLKVLVGMAPNTAASSVPIGTEIFAAPGSSAAVSTRHRTVTPDEHRTINYVLGQISPTPTVPDHLNRNYHSLVVNSIVWAPWNLFIGPSDRPIGLRPGFDAKEAYIMESVNPLSFPAQLWDVLKKLN